MFEEELDIYIQAYLGDIVALVPDHHNIVNKSESKEFFCFPVHINVYTEVCEVYNSFVTKR